MKRSLALAALLPFLAMVQATCVIVDDAVTCTVDGRAYREGERFPAPDGCNTCVCGADGTAACTAMGCISTCEYDGHVHVEGDSFASTDGCNTCTCLHDGTVACTERACVTCVYLGATYDPGDTFPSREGCNECTCADDGSVGCTKVACACDPVAEWWREYAATDPDTCQVIDYVCPANTEMFFNDCGCGCEQSTTCPEWFDCMPPTPCDPGAIAEECPYSAIEY